MRAVGVLAGVTAATLVVGGITIGLTGDDGPTADPGRDPDRVLAAGVGLVGFDACDSLVDHLVTSAAKSDPWLLTGNIGWMEEGDVAMDDAAEPAAPTAGAGESARSSSDTNVQVAGVDEPDLVETDGLRLFSVANGRLQVTDVSSPAPAPIADVAVPGDVWDEGQLLLHEDRLLGIFPRWGDVRLGGVAFDARFAPQGTQTTLVALWDVSDEVPVLVAEMEVEGHLVSARAIDGTAHLIVSHQPQPLPADALDEVWNARTPEDASKVVLTALADTTATDWLPALRHTDARGVVSEGSAVDCLDVKQTSEVNDTAMLQVLTLAMQDDDLQPEGATAVLTSAMTVTASATELVVATPVWPRMGFPGGPLPVDPGIGGVEFDDTVEPPPAPDAPPVELEDAPKPETEEAVPAVPEVAPAVAAEPVAPIAESTVTTRLHLFDLGDGGASYRASGVIDGTLLNQFSMSLDDGRLRTAATVGDMWAGNSESVVSVLEARNDTLEVVGAVGGLGRGEQIHSVRFVGDRGYVVTFRQTDPLYTIDLSDPVNPVATGELKITGYSAYLHPLSDDILLGVGQEATEQGQTLGTQVALFDVSDPAAPTRIAQVVVPNAWSEAEWDHHAVLVHDGVLALPYERWFEPSSDHPEGYESGALVVGLGDRTLEVRGSVTQTGVDTESFDMWSAAIRRIVSVDGTLFTVSRHAVEGFDATTLTSTGAAVFGS